VILISQPQRDIARSKPASTSSLREVAPNPGDRLLLNPTGGLILEKKVDFRLSLLGGFGLAVDGKYLKFATRKESSLYAYLTLHQEKGAIRRERLAGLLWPDVDEQRARRNLSTALWRIKFTLRNNDALPITPQTSGELIGIKLDPNAVDALKFQRLLETTQNQSDSGRLSMLSEAESLYAGDLLDEYDDEWCEDARRHLRGQYVNILRQLSSIHKHQARYADALLFSRKLIALEPLDEEAHRELMLLYHLSGNKHAALDQYEALRQNLRLELGIEPNEATTQLYQYIRTLAPDTELIFRSVPRSDPTSANQTIPLIGRDHYTSIILERVEDSAKGRGSAILMSGEAGIGKTRLVEAIVTEARLRGVQVFQGGCPDLQNPPPYQVIFQALWPRVIEATGSEGPGSPLGAILRALSSKSPKVKGKTSILEPTLNTTIVTEAILGLIDGQSAKKPTVLILEDIHRIDQASLTLLATLLDRISSMQLVVLATIRSDERKSDEITSSLTSNGAVKVSLPPLSETELQRLVRAILRDKSVSKEVLSLVWDRTDGVPLFALELVDFMVAEGHIHKATSGQWDLRGQTSNIPDQFPSRVNEVIRRRIDLLDREAGKVLVTAAILGMEFSLRHLVSLSGHPEETVAECLDRLIDHRLVVASEEKFRFCHETIRAVVLELPTEARRRLLHLRAGIVLEKSGSFQPEDLHVHFLEAHKIDKALAYAETSADKARGVHANINAAAWYTRAIELVDRVDAPSRDRLRKRIQLLIKRHEVLEVLGDPTRVDHINSIHDLSKGLDDKRLHARVQYLRARTISRLKRPEEALVAAIAACKLYRDIGDLSGEAAATETLGEIYLYLRDNDKAKVKLEKAIHLFHQAGDHVGEARVLVTGSMILSCGDISATLESLERAEILLNGSEELQIRAKLLAQKGICYRLLGQARMSESSIRAGLELIRRTGDRVSEARTRPQLATTLSSLGRHAEAIREARHGIYLAQQTKDNRALITGLNNAAFCAYRLSGALKHAQAAVLTVLRMTGSISPNENVAIYKDTLATICLEQGDIESALKVALQAKTLCSRDFLGFAKGDAYHHLGNIYLAKNDYDTAIHWLQKAIAIFQSKHDLYDELLVTASLTIALVEGGKTKLADKYANQIPAMLREVEGVEQLQYIFWSQYRAFHATGKLVEARRALDKAYEAVESQARFLKGRNRLRFLSNLKINRTILAEVAQAGV